MDAVVAATIGANLEDKFKELTDPSSYSIGDTFDFSFTVPDKQSNGVVEHSCSLRVVDVMQFESNDVLYDANGNPVNVDGPKGIILADDSGNIFVHFNGTGDGKWRYNSTNYGGLPSEIQTDSLHFFDQFIEENYLGGKIYVSGHSQGGNTAQYVSLNSKYGDYIEICSSLDGPRLSIDAVNAVIDQYGEAYFQRQREKIYGFYGEHDYVSPLGQYDTIPEDHIMFVENTGGDFHCIDGMMNGNNLNTLKTEGSAFRELVVALNAKINSDLGPETQKEAAALAMKFAEYFLGTGKNGPNLVPTLTQEDLDSFKDVLFPLLVEFAAEHPEMITPALISIGMDEEMAKLIENVVLEFNALPEDMRKEVLNSLGECIVINENGELVLNADVKEIFESVIMLLPTILEVARDNPELLLATLKELGVDQMLLGFLTEHPLLAAGATLLLGLFTPQLLKLVGNVAALGYLVEGFYAMVETLKNLGEKIENFIRNTLQAILDTVDKLKQYIHSLTPGARYASSNPYFRADTALLRSYADRLRTVNSNLMSLDRDMNDLYWQVGLLDVLDILQANIIAGYSARVGLARKYLNSAADRLEEAETKALGYLGG